MSRENDVISNESIIKAGSLDVLEAAIPSAVPSPLVVPGTFTIGAHPGLKR